MKLLTIKTVALKLSGWDRISHCRRNTIQQQDTEVERFKMKYRVVELKFLRKAPVNSDMF